MHTLTLTICNEVRWDDKDEDQYGLKEVVNESMEVVSGKRVDVRVSCTDNVESVLQLKCRAITKKDKPPPITLLSYLWVDDKVGTYFILYSDNLSILHFINYARVCPFVDDDFSPIHLCACRNDTFANPNWVFLAKEKSMRGDRSSIGETTNVTPLRDYFYVYDCILCCWFISSKFSIYHFHKLSGNRLHKPSNRLQVQKDISILILTLIKEFC